MAGWRDTIPSGTLYIDVAGKGWGETIHPMGATPQNLANAGAAYKEYVSFRRLILAKDESIKWARTVLGDRSRRRVRAIAAPVGPLALSTEGAGIEACNDAKSCLHIAFETAAGDFVNMFFRGLRDSWTLGNALTVAPIVPASVVYGTDDVAGLSAAVALGNFIRAFMKYARYVVEDPGSPGNPVTTSFTDYVIRGITARDTGGGFGRGRGRRRAGSL